MSKWNPDRAMLDLARDLTSIVSMCDRLSEEAGYQFADKENPGGDAVVMVGPAANLREWEAIYDATEAGEYHTESARKAATAYVQDQTAELHPLLVLATWEDVIRDELGTPTQARASVAKAAAYIRSAIPWIFDTNQDGDMNFIAVDQLGRDLRQCVTMLENLLKDGRREDHGVPCMNCGEPLLRVRYRQPHRVDQPDTWKCTPCGETSTMDQYNQAVKSDYLRCADRLTATDMLTQYRIRPGALTGWVSKGLVAKRGKDHSGRILYDVAQAVAQRDKYQVATA